MVAIAFAANAGVIGSSSKPAGFGVEGINQSTTGNAVGVQGISKSSGGTGLFGHGFSICDSCTLQISRR